MWLCPNTHLKAYQCSCAYSPCRTVCWLCLGFFSQGSFYFPIPWEQRAALRTLMSNVLGFCALVLCKNSFSMQSYIESTPSIPSNMHCHENGILSLNRCNQMFVPFDDATHLTPRFLLCITRQYSSPAQEARPAINCIPMYPHLWICSAA
jgi:hypothetical protein